MLMKYEFVFVVCLRVTMPPCKIRKQRFLCEHWNFLYKSITST